MSNATKIGFNAQLTLAGVTVNSVVLWAVAITADAGWMVYGLLLLHNAITVTQVNAMFKSQREFT